MYTYFLKTSKPTHIQTWTNFSSSHLFEKMQFTAILEASSYSARAARPWVKSHRTVATKQKTFSCVEVWVVGPSLKTMF